MSTDCRETTGLNKLDKKKFPTPRFVRRGIKKKISVNSSLFNYDFRGSFTGFSSSRLTDPVEVTQNRGGGPVVTGHALTFDLHIEAKPLKSLL